MTNHSSFEPIPTHPTLNTEALAVLADAGIDPAEYVYWAGAPDACGCVDDRCIGYHHTDAHNCGCLWPSIEQFLDERYQR